MKKFSLLLMIVLIVGAIFVSCSAEPSADATKVATVALSLDTAKELQVYTEVETLPAADTLYWYYTATKRNGGFTTGATTVVTPIRADNGKKGLPQVIGQTGIANNKPISGTWFSTGDWTFCFYGVKAIETSNGTDTSYAEGRVVYKAENVELNVKAATEDTNIGATASITLELAHDTRSGSTFELDGPVSVKLGTAYDSGATYKLKAYVDGVVVKDGEADLTITGGAGTEAGEVTFIAGIKTLKTFASPDNQLHLVEFKMYKGNDTATVYASGKIGLIARMGYTYKICGALDSLESVAWVGINASLPENLDSANQAITELTIADEYQLRAFASYVNQGNKCAGMTIKLTADIPLTGGDWIPIGNSARKTADKYFAGIFDGQGHTISGLTLSTETTNLMYDKNQQDASADGMYFNEYIFGLFGVVKNATIKNLTLANVNIKSLNRDIDSTHRLTGENVGALIGYSNGSLTVEGVTVSSGSVAAGSNVAGIIGRAYGAANCSISIKNCTNNANITATNGSGNKAKAAGIVGYVSGLGATVTIEGCSNTGALSSTAERNAIAAGIANYGFNNSVTDNYTVKDNTNSGSITLSNNGPLYAKISAECNDGKGSGDSISATGNSSTGTVTLVGDNNVANDVTETTPLVRSSQSGSEVNSNN